ncbi:MAG: hypothetical protein JKX85_12950 [Phycisphaeraceae bacterium]|nr:hypothetical protein [Phycisphaeraceae bacterium]
MNLTHSPETIAAVQAPSFKNQNTRAWDQSAQVVYYFACHARHDLANVHCALGMLEMVEQIQKDHPETPLPAELDPETIRTKCGQDIKKVIRISNAMILLSQASATPAYQATQTTSLAKIIQQHITDQVDNQELDPSALLASTDQARVLSMGDMLGTALAVCFFQWTPSSQPQTQILQACITHHHRSVCLHIPSDNAEMINQFANQLNVASDDPLSVPLDQHLTTCTGTVALWLARHIIIIHGGNLAVDANNPTLSLTVTLPTMD